jgi:hypothetical protein
METNSMKPTALHARKADGDDFSGRFREIVSDPLNLAIRRVPLAGVVDGGLVVLHNGLRVPVSGPDAYYGGFSAILEINRGVHEPLEEFVFQELIKRLPESPSMLELGAYWGHYSMWLKSVRPGATVHLVEPDLNNLQSGMNNFDLNEIDGEFIHAFVGKDDFIVDKYLSDRRIGKLDILHSDIQGYELEMLEGSRNALGSKAIDYVFVSTHSQELHSDAVERLAGFGYRIEISSDFDYGTTSYDGFVFASSPAKTAVFTGFSPMSRIQILDTSPAVLAEYVSRVVRQTGNG